MTDLKVEWVASDGLHADHASTPGNYLPIPVVRLEQHQAALAAKEEELARVTKERDEYRTLNEHHKDEFLTANLKLARLRRDHDTLLGEAVWAMEYIKRTAERWGPNLDRAEAFLARPDVREWQGRQKEGTV